MSIPYSSIKVVLKQVKFDALEEIEKKNLQFFFPGYEATGFTITDPKPGTLMEIAKEKGFKTMQDNSMPRRFAGDLTLPRSRYFTVCRDNSGFDYETLINELRAYTRSEKTGHFLTIDSSGIDETSKYFKKFLVQGSDAIFCYPQETQSFPNEYREAIGFNTSKSKSPAIGIIPLHIEETKIDKVIDLRLPNVQEWFTRELTSLKDPNSGEPVFKLAPQLTEFKKLLPTLLAQSLGDGRGVTQIAGRWLRNNGANALIFPSARSDCFTKFLNGQLVDWGGWNLVDYRGTPEVWIGGSVDLSLEWDEYPMTGGNFLSEEYSEPTIYNGTKISSSNEGLEAGSLIVDGLKEQRWYYYTLNTWFYFANQIKIKYHNIDVDELNKAIFLLSSKDYKISVKIASGIAGVFLGSIFNGEQQIQALNEIRDDFKAKDIKIYQAISSFLNLCNS